MAVILSITYQKKLGLPNFSSHSCQVSLTVEIPDVSMAGQESTKLYQLLQSAVDQQIQAVGFMPDATTYGMKPSQNGNGHHPTDGNGYRANGNGSNGHHAPAQPDAWKCTEGQKNLVLRIVNESRLNKNEVEDMAQGLFGVGVKELDKMQASQLIEELLEKTGKAKRPRWGNRQPART
jgi:hypothetical protein